MRMSFETRPGSVYYDRAVRTDVEKEVVACKKIAAAAAEKVEKMSVIASVAGAGKGGEEKAADGEKNGDADEEKEHPVVDNFVEVMTEFATHARDTVKEHQKEMLEAAEEAKKLIKFFGENPSNAKVEDVLQTLNAFYVDYITAVTDLSKAKKAAAEKQMKMEKAAARRNAKPIGGDLAAAAAASDDGGPGPTRDGRPRVRSAGTRRGVDAAW